MTEDIQELAKWLKELECQAIAMESVVYWKPVYNILEEEGDMEIIVCNAQHIKAVPGRKTDTKDAEWIADLTRHGLVKPSFIPDINQRESRELARYRQNLVEERARELNRIQAVLEGANIKICSLISDIDGASGTAILKAIISGETDPEALVKVITGQLSASSVELKRALNGHIREYQQIMLKVQVQHLEFLTNQIKQLDHDVKKSRLH